MAVLVNQKNRKQMKPGDKVTTFRGQTYTLMSPMGRPPVFDSNGRAVGSSGKIWLRTDAGGTLELYPSVCELEWEAEFGDCEGQ